MQLSTNAEQFNISLLPHHIVPHSARPRLRWPGQDHPLRSSFFDRVEVSNMARERIGIIVFDRTGEQVSENLLSEFEGQFEERELGFQAGGGA